MNNSAGGFIYFDTNSPQQSSPHKDDTNNFLAFSSYSPQSQQRFTPNNYSSPQTKFNGGGNYSRGRNSNQRRGRPYSYGGGNGSNRFYHNNSGGGNNNSSFNSSYNSSPNTSQRGYNRRNNSSTIDSFVHPSFMENPWAKLEQKLNAAKNETDGSSMSDNLRLVDDGVEKT